MSRPEMTRLPIKLTPGASADRIDGWGVDAEGRAVLLARVRARPVEGEANAALLKLLAKTLDLRVSALSIQRGGQSRTKMVVVDGMTDDDLKRRLTDP